MTIEEWKNIASIIESVITALALIIGGIWTYRKFILLQEKYPNIEFRSDIELIGYQDGYWIAEIIATIDNKGKAQHKMRKFEFDLNALFSSDEVNLSDKWGKQIDFPHPITNGSFLPKGTNFFFVDPGTKAKYSHITRIPNEATFVILHCWFNYTDNRSYGHTAEKTIEIPQLSKK